MLARRVTRSRGEGQSRGPPGEAELLPVRLSEPLEQMKCALRQRFCADDVRVTQETRISPRLILASAAPRENAWSVDRLEP